MIKLDIIHEVVNRTGISKTKAAMAVEAVFDRMKVSLGRGERIELRGFAIFEVRPRKPGVGRNPLTGAKVENLSPAVASDLQLGFNSTGVVLIATADNTFSSNYGFQPGDIIRSVNGAPIGSVGQLQAALNGAAHWDMIVQRGEQKLTLSVSE